MTLWVGSGPSDPLLGYFWHRLAVQAEIGQNRSIFPKWTNQPCKIGTNGLTEPAGPFAPCGRKANRGRAGRRLPLCADPSPNCFGSDHTLSAKSEVGLTLAGSPLRAILPPSDPGHPVSSVFGRNLLTGSVCRGAWQDSLSDSYFRLDRPINFRKFQ